jgi:hypothetical protein
MVPRTKAERALALEMPPYDDVPATKPVLPLDEVRLGVTAEEVEDEGPAALN